MFFYFMELKKPKKPVYKSLIIVPLSGIKGDYLHFYHFYSHKLAAEWFHFVLLGHSKIRLNPALFNQLPPTTHPPNPQNPWFDHILHLLPNHRVAVESFESITRIEPLSDERPKLPSNDSSSIEWGAQYRINRLHNYSHLTVKMETSTYDWSIPSENQDWRDSLNLLVGVLQKTQKNE